VLVLDSASRVSAMKVVSRKIAYMGLLVSRACGMVFSGGHILLGGFGSQLVFGRVA
jgi:hypothetical protein